jgi:pSer/pThr/pTyr-binding forkhead associated (FHA) protein
VTGGTDSPLAPHAATPAELRERIEAERRGDPFLVFRDGDGHQRLVVLDPVRGRATVGRSQGNDVALVWDTEVSRLHAELERLGDEWTVGDDGLSRNGSFVNEERVSGRRRLRDGDIVRVGRSSVLFRAPAEAAGESTVVSSDLLGVAGVSPAQRRVLLALCRPFKEGAAFATPSTNAEIAAELHLSVDAVKTHLRALFEKFDLADVPQSGKRVALVQRALQTGLVAERDL